MVLHPRRSFMAVDVCVWKPLPQQPLHRHELCTRVLRFVDYSTNEERSRSFIRESVSVEDVTWDLALNSRRMRSFPSFVAPRRHAERALALLCSSGALQRVQTGHDQSVIANRRYRIPPRVRPLPDENTDDESD